MKKVLKLVLVLAMLAALTVTAFAASPRTFEVPNNSGAREIIRIMATTSDPDITVECVPPTGGAANETAAESLAEDNAFQLLDSFDIVIRKNGEIVHEGATVEVTIEIPEDHVQDYLAVLENTYGDIEIAFSAPLNGRSQITFTLTKFSTFTPVLIGAPVSAGTSPQTSQSIVPVALICVAGMALIAVVIATKRKFN